MPPALFTLLTTPSPSTFLTAIRALPDRPLWLGQTHHWLHTPTLSLPALTGSGSTLHPWSYLLITLHQPSTPLQPPTSLQPYITHSFSVLAPITPENLSSLSTSTAKRSNTTHPVLPPGWSLVDSSALQNAQPAADLSASLALASPLFNTPKTDTVPLKTFIPDFTASHPGPMAVFNLLSYFPGQRERYFEYIAAFSTFGAKYGGEPVVLGLGVEDWSSREEDLKVQEGGWEDVAVIGYPSLWHFAAMLEDEGYVEADRRFKTEVLRDNPLVLCTEVEL